MSDAPEDTMRGRTPGSGRRLWLLVGADRRLVAGLVLGVVFVGLAGLGTVHPAARAALSSGDPVETLFQALVTATITSVTLVVTLGQLVLTQELGAVGDQRERMRGALEFRRDVETVIEPAVSPAAPAAFLRALVETTRGRAEALGAASDDPAVAAYVERVIGNAETVTERLEDAQFGEFAVVRAALDYDYSWKLVVGRRLAVDGLDEEAAAALEALLDALELFGPAREHFKTLYFRWELADLSRAMLYAAVPAIVVAAGALLYLDPADLSGATAGVAHAPVVVALATTAAVVPFALLLSYVVRIVTVTKRTLSVGPFVLRETGRSDPASAVDRARSEAESE